MANDFLKEWNPDRQKGMLRCKEECYFGNAPTLSELNRKYGRNMAASWLMIQLDDLSEFSGCRKKMSGDSLEECSHLIADKYFYLKVSEIMLFMQLFKCGDYGRFYGAVDAMVIMTALKDFCRERNEIMARREREHARSKREEGRKNAISHEEWLRLKRDNV